MVAVSEVFEGLWEALFKAGLFCLNTIYCGGCEAFP